MHIHIDAGFEQRALRYAAIRDGDLSFESIDTQPVESMVDALRGLADTQVRNDLSLEFLDEEIRRVGEKLLTDWSARCRSPSS